MHKLKINISYSVLLHGKKTNFSILHQCVVFEITARRSSPSIFKIKKRLKDIVSQSTLRVTAVCPAIAPTMQLLMIRSVVS